LLESQFHEDNQERPSRASIKTSIIKKTIQQNPSRRTTANHLLLKPITTAKPVNHPVNNAVKHPVNHH
jgi:hypothetical protein